MPQFVPPRGDDEALAEIAGGGERRLAA